MVQMPNRDDATRPGNAIDKLTHEMAEALTAISGYLHASHQLQGLDDPASRARLHEGITKAIEQAARAGEAVAQLRVQNRGTAIGPAGHAAKSTRPRLRPQQRSPAAA